MTDFNMIFLKVLIPTLADFSSIEGAVGDRAEGTKFYRGADDGVHHVGEAITFLFNFQYKYFPDILICLITLPYV